MILSRILAIPELILFLFAFLVHFVYEVWQAPYFVFYDMPSLASKINYITHCTIGDGIISVISFWVVSLLFRTRKWILDPMGKQILLFTAAGWLYTFISEIYRIKIETSWLPLVQWLILPPLVIFLTERHLRGEKKR